MVDSHAVVRNTTESPPGPFTQFVPVVTASPYNQDIDIGSAKAQNASIASKSLRVPYLGTPAFSPTPNPSLTLDNHSSALYTFVISVTLCKWNHAACHLLGSPCFTQYNSLEVHPSCCTYPRFVPFSCWVVFHAVARSQFALPCTQWGTSGLCPVWGCCK